MEIKLRNKNLNLSEMQQEYVTRKIDHIKKVAKRGTDESAKAQIEIEHVKHKNPSESIGMKVNLSLPGRKYHAECFATTIEEAVDRIEAKLVNQIDHDKR